MSLVYKYIVCCRGIHGNVQTKREAVKYIYFGCDGWNRGTYVS